MLSWVFPVQAITLWPLIICRLDTDEIMLNHEKIHLEQQRELFIVGFYMLYLFFWIKHLNGGKMNAYYEIPFEIEAYRNQSNANYLKNRKPFAWVR
jgi:hypothetical protein